MPAEKYTAASPPPSPVHFIIEVTLETDRKGTQHCVPRNIPRVMNPGDTVNYESPDGKVTVTFTKGTPYADAKGHDLTEVHSGKKLVVKNLGNYFSHCAITVKEKNAKTQKLEPVTYDWANDPKSGGNVVVKGG